MPQLIWSPAALRDVERLYRFLADKNPDAARRAARSIREGMNILHDQPGVGRPVEDMDLPQHDSPPMLTLKVQKALEGADKANAPKRHSIRRWAQAALQQDGVTLSVPLGSAAPKGECVIAWIVTDVNLQPAGSGRGPRCPRGAGGGPLSGRA